MDKQKKPDSYSLKPEYSSAAMSLGAALKAYGLGEMRNLNVCFPACIRSYDNVTHIAEVMPLIKQGYFDGEWKYIDRFPYKVTVRSIQCGGFTIDIPLYVGDTGWVFSSDRDTALLKQEGALTNSVLAKDRPLALVDSSYQQKPAQPVLHDFMRGVFIPDNWGKWEFKRFKDNEDPEIDLEKSLYIGDSIGTKDENQKDEETQERTSASDLQKGEEYEKNPSSALIFERGVGVHLVSSTKKEDSKISRARVSLKGNVIESFVEDTENDVKIKTEMGYENGFYIEQKYKDSKFKLKNKDGKLSIETNGKDWEADVLLEKGTIKIETKGRIIVDSSRGGLNINTGKSTTIKAEKANVISEGNINVISKGGVSIKSTSTIALETLNKIDIGAIGSIKLKSGSDMRFLSDPDSGTGPTEFHAGRKIEIEGKDKISYSSRYYGLSLSSRELEIIGGSSSIKCLEETIEIQTTKNILAEAKFSSITLQSRDCIAMPNFHLETLPDFQKGSFDGVGAWVPKKKDK